MGFKRVSITAHMSKAKLLQIFLERIRDEKTETRRVDLRSAFKKVLTEALAGKYRLMHAVEEDKT